MQLIRDIINYNKTCNKTHQSDWIEKWFNLFAMSKISCNWSQLNANASVDCTRRNKHTHTYTHSWSIWRDAPHQERKKYYISITTISIFIAYIALYLNKAKDTCSSKLAMNAIHMKRSLNKTTRHWTDNTYQDSNLYKQMKIFKAYIADLLQEGIGNMGWKRQ